MTPLLAVGQTLCLVVGLRASAGRVSAQAANLATVVRAFNEALNAGDGAGALALFAEDAVVRTPGGSIYVG